MIYHELTAKEKFKIINKAINYLFYFKYRNSICLIISEIFIQKYKTNITIINCFELIPELILIKPSEKEFGEFWFPQNIIGRAKRIYFLFKVKRIIYKNLMLFSE